MSQLEMISSRYCVKCHKTAIALAIIVALMALFPLAYAKDEQVNLSEIALLNITKSLFKLTDGKAEYSVQIKNEGQVLLKNVQVTDSLPSGMVYIERVASGLPLLIGIENNADKTTRSLTWYLGNIDTGQEKWVNFTVRMLNPSAYPPLHRVHAKGWAFNYLIEGEQKAMPYFSLQSDSKEAKTSKALATLPAAIMRPIIKENASVMGNGIGMQNESDIQKSL